MAIAVLAGLWLHGNLDEPLSHVGLNRHTCASNLFGARLCGDDLVAFCRQRYDSELNGATCQGVLEDAGYDVPRRKDTGFSAGYERIDP